MVPKHIRYFFCSLSVLNVTSSFPQASSDVCPRLGQGGCCKPHVPPWGWSPGDPGMPQGTVELWECRQGWAVAFWFVCEISEDVFSTLPGLTVEGCWEYFSTLFRAHSPAIPLSSYPRKKVCLRWLLQKSFSCSFWVKSLEISWEPRYHLTISLTHHKIPIFLLEHVVCITSVCAGPRQHQECWERSACHAEQQSLNPDFPNIFI